MRIVHVRRRYHAGRVGPPKTTYLPDEDVPEPAFFDELTAAGDHCGDHERTKRAEVEHAGGD